MGIFSLEKIKLEQTRHPEELDIQIRLHTAPLTQLACSLIPSPRERRTVILLRKEKTTMEARESTPGQRKGNCISKVSEYSNTTTSISTVGIFPGGYQHNSHTIIIVDSRYLTDCLNLIY